MNTLLRLATLMLLGIAMFTTCTTPSMPAPDPAAAIITSMTPSVMIPGGPLRLTGTNLSRAKSIDFMDENGVAIATVPAGSFLPTSGSYSLSDPPDLGYVTVQVPIDVSASYVRINNEHGPGNLQRVSNGHNSTSYTNDVLTTNNIATNVSAFVTTPISDSKCNPSYFYYCMAVPKGSWYPEEYSSPDHPNTPPRDASPVTDSRIVIAFKQSSKDCQKVYYDSVRMGGGNWYRVFTAHTNIGPNGAWEFPTPIRLKLERNSLNTGYTGTAVITIETFGGNYKQYTYVGSMVKTPGSKTGNELFDIKAYEVKTGEEIRLCNQKGYFQGSCPDCQ